MGLYGIGSSTGRLPSHVVDFMKGARRSTSGDVIPRLIPSETASGQIGMFPAGAYRVPRVRATPPTTPPFRGGYTLARGTGPSSRAVLRTHVQQAARRAEKEQIRLAAARAKAKARKTGTGRVPGKAYPDMGKVPVEGPRTASQHKVDDLFGVIDRPMQTRYL